jgi:hypothetical protein
MLKAYDWFRQPDDTVLLQVIGGSLPQQRQWQVLL